MFKRKRPACIHRVVWRSTYHSANRHKRQCSLFSVQVLDDKKAISSSSTSDDIATPPPDERIGSHHSPPNPQWCAPISGCGDRLLLINSSDSSPLAIDSGVSTDSAHCLHLDLNPKHAKYIIMFFQSVARRATMRTEPGTGFSATSTKYPPPPAPESFQPKT